LESGRRQAGGRRTPVQGIELGNEPPLGLDGDVEEPIDRRRVSIRWLAATVLAAFSGAALMGGAVWAALDGEYRFAQLPEMARMALRSAGERVSNIARKADRITILADHSTARQTLRVSTTTRVAEREIVRVRPFIRVATNLSLSPSQFAAAVPVFNPVKLMAEDEERPDDGPQIEPTGELSIVMRDLLQVPPSARVAAAIRNDDVHYAVRQAIMAETTGGTLRPSLAAGLGLGLMGPGLAYAAEDDPRASIEPPAIAENMNSVPKTASEASGGNTWSERTVVAKKGESLPGILNELGAAPQATTALVAAFGARGRDGGISDGHRIRVLLDTMPDGQVQPLRVSIFGEKGHEATVALGDNGRYVAVEEPREIDVASLRSEEESDEGSGMRLYQSIYETALRNEIPRPMIDSIIRTFSFDVDLHRRVRPGDSFEVLYAGDEPDASGDVLYASLVFGDEARRYYRFLTPDDGIPDYYDEAGKSAKKFLVRKPMGGGIFRSGFGPRKHPILGYVRQHTGIDWSDTTGAPIFAAGNGTVLKAEWDRGGYGRRVEIQHLNGYVTSYSHLSGFARGIQSGSKVRQGQIIGYVGNTGLSTGPHLHYEVMINGNFVDPMRIRLPRGRELDGGLLKGFERERERIDSILERGAAMPRVAAN